MKWLSVVALFLSLLPSVGHAIPSPLVTAEVFPSVSQLAPGGNFAVAIRFSIAPGWHTYWAHPGDSGLPTTVTWRQREGVELGPLEFPIPKQFTQPGNIVGYGYEGEVTHLVRASLSPDFPPGNEVNLEGMVRWLACAELCVPGSKEFSMSVPVRKASIERSDLPFREWFSALPLPLGVGADAPFILTTKGRLPGPVGKASVTVAVEFPTVAERSVQFFPQVYRLLRLRDTLHSQTLSRYEVGFSAEADGARPFTGSTFPALIVVEESQRQSGFLVEIPVR